MQARMAEIRALTPRTAQKSTAADGTQAAEADFSEVLSEAIRSSETVPQAAAGYTESMSTADARGSYPGGITVTSVRVGTASRVRPQERAGRVSWNGTATSEIISQAAPYRSIIEEASATFGVPANIIMSVIKCESDYSESETSHSGAMGLMQVMPFNAEDYGITEPYEPRQNIFCGTWEIGELLKMYDGDLKLAITGYNIGCGTLRRLGVSSSDSAAYRERVPEAAQRYAEKVLRLAGAAA